MRKARVLVYPRCTWPCDSRTTHGAALAIEHTGICRGRPQQATAWNALNQGRDSTEVDNPKEVRCRDNA